MTSEVFLDTGFAIALSVATDEHHQGAVALADQLEAAATCHDTGRFVGNRQRALETTLSPGGGRITDRVRAG